MLKTVSRGLIVMTALLISPLWAQADSHFDTCVNSLYKSGGMSLRESQELCLKKPNDQLLSCQNNLFQIAFKDPQTSFSICSENNHADDFYKGQVYRGQFQSFPSGSKKTVCSITVNSEEERESFRKMLPEQNYDFVELLPAREDGRFITRDSHWLERSCQSQVRCDVLVFSGHFADSFIGDAGFEISMAELKKYKSQAQCANFFDSIKEVYLFGCNTLASKKPDHRSVDQYINVLVEDGVAPHTAQRIAARRYTPYDHSVSEKMNEIFSSASLIAGFPSTGPTGSHIQKTLEKYLREEKEDSTLDDKIKSFSQTLGQLGMTYRLPGKNPLSKSINPTTSELVLDDPQSLNKKDLIKYIQQYGSTLPVATVDVLTAALNQQSLNAQDLEALKADLQKRWATMSPRSQQTQLCPLILADHETWLPANLDCYKDTSWLRQR